MAPKFSRRLSDRQRRIGARVAFACCFVPMRAYAHPFGDGYAAQRLDVRIDRRGVDVGFMADVPDPFIGPTVDEAAVTRMLDQLGYGLTVTVDGVTVPLTERSRDVRQDLVTMHSRVMELVFRADVNLGGAHTIEVSNGNLSGEPCFYLSTLVVPPSTIVADSSLLAAPRDTDAVDLSSRWSRSELRRRVKARFELPEHPWASLVDALPPPDGGADAVDHIDLLSARLSAADAWLAGARNGGSAAIATALAAIAGVRLPQRGASSIGQRWRVMGLTGAALLVAWAVRTSGLWAPLPAILAALVAGAWLGWRRALPMAWLAIAALWAGLPWIWRPLVALGAAVGAAVGLAIETRPARDPWLLLAIGAALAAWGYAPAGGS